MERVTITLDAELMKSLDRYAAARRYQNRSEAVRDLLRSGLQEAALDSDGGKGETVVALAYVYDHHVRDLAKRLTQEFHHHHDFSLASLHVHLDEERCMEVSVLRGPGDKVRRFAQHIVAERGVKHGRIFAIPGPR